MNIKKWYTKDAEQYHKGMSFALTKLIMPTSLYHKGNLILKDDSNSFIDVDWEELSIEDLSLVFKMIGGYIHDLESKTGIEKYTEEEVELLKKEDELKLYEKLELNHVQNNPNSNH